MEQPVYKHNCQHCVFLGHYKNHDLYVCKETVLARYGHRGMEYMTGFDIALSGSDHPLAEAMRRSQCEPRTVLIN